MSEQKGFGMTSFIDGIGSLKVELLLDEDVTYEDLLSNKKYVAKKTIFLLNEIYKTFGGLDD